MDIPKACRQTWFAPAGDYQPCCPHFTPFKFECTSPPLLFPYFWPPTCHRYSHRGASLPRRRWSITRVPLVNPYRVEPHPKEDFNNYYTLPTRVLVHTHPFMVLVPTLLATHHMDLCSTASTHNPEILSGPSLAVNSAPWWKQMLVQFNCITCTCSRFSY